MDAETKEILNNISYEIRRLNNVVECITLLVAYKMGITKESCHTDNNTIVNVFQSMIDDEIKN